MNTETIDTHEKEFRGFKLRVNVHLDNHMGPPWKVHDGHGDVSGWKSKDDKAPGERMMSGDGGSYRFYDWQGAIQKAKAEGWGISDEAKAELAKRKGKPVAGLTRGEIIEAAVQFDFEYLAGWANDEWHWLGYTAEYSRDDGETWEDANASCWGFDEEKYMVESAFDELESEVRSIAEKEMRAALDKANRTFWGRTSWTPAMA